MKRLRLWFRYYLLAREQGARVRVAARVSSMLVRLRHVPLAELYAAVRQPTRRLRLVRG